MNSDEPAENRPHEATRRRFLQTGGVAIGSLATGLNSSVQAAAIEAPAKRAIVILLQGGCSQLDTWDMKPSAPSEYRGEFDSIATTLGLCRINLRMFADDDPAPNRRTARILIFLPHLFLPTSLRKRQKEVW